ncbi:acyl-CoA-binding protein, putative [Plasmodium reichenowi]|uniref:Acyl-CoA-binding protein, putative n=1 Tax=Plasmodium reichenowi TaxID=5854 RepID=A0A060RU56_PLARE|nr:acyl-CoA-binding protein, putative [Plasmodium reichenowi]
MLKNINKPVIFFNVLTGLAFIYLLKNYNENTKHILNKLYSLKNWIVQYSCSFLKRYESIQLPIIDKDIIVDLSNEELEQKFVQTCNAVKMYRTKLKTEEWLHLYGLFKQATIGNMILRNEEESTKSNDTSSNNNDTSSKNYDTSSKNYDTSSKNYDTSSKNYDTSSKNYDTSSKNYDTSSENYDTSSNNNDTSSYNNIENISNIDGKKKKKNKNKNNKNTNTNNNNNNNNNNNKNNNNNMEFIEIQKRKAWKNCYNVNKNTCKYLYVQYFNKLFPDALEKLNNDDNMKFSKTVSKMKPFKEQNKKHLENENNDDDNNICDILCQHVVMGDLASIKKNLKHNPSLINKKNSSGLTPLHYACDRGYIDIVKYLVHQGANINVEDSYGDTPLHMAAYSEKLNVVDFLKSVGADINKTNSEGLTIDWILSQN